MGVIQRQSIKFSIISYLGVFIAFFATMFIYKQDEEIYGFAQFILNLGFLLIPFVSLGTYSAIIKFFPPNKDNRKQYLNSFLLLFFGASLIFLLFYLLFSHHIHDFLEFILIDKERIIEQYDYLIIPLAIVLALNLLLTNQASNLLRITIPEMVTNIGFKLLLPIIIYAAIMGWVTKDQIPIYILLSHGFLVLIIVFYLSSLGTIGITQGVIKDIRKNTKQSIASYSLFSSLNSLSATVAFRVDVIMVATMIGMGANGIYTMMIFLTTIIEIPRKAIYKIANPIISQAWSNKDFAKLEYLYKSTSINLMIPSFFLAIGIYIGLPLLDVISVGQPIFYEWRFVFLLIASAKVIDISLSVNTQLIDYSSWYRYNLLFLITLAVSNIILNYFAIKSYGMIGAASATAFSYILFNLMKLIFIWYTMKMCPFSSASLKLLLVTVVLVLALYFMPTMSNVWIDTIFKSAFFAILYLSAVWFFKISPELNQLISKYLPL